MKKTTCIKNVKLVSFLYELMRDHVPPGIVEGILVRDEKCGVGNNGNAGDYKLSMCNGYLGNYAEDVADRLSAISDDEMPEGSLEKKADNPKLLAGGHCDCSD